MQAQTHRPAIAPLPGPRPQPAGVAPARPTARLTLRPAAGLAPRRPAFAVPGTVPFADASQAWFWTVASLAARRDGTGGGGGSRVRRPCDPDDVIRALDLLYRRGGIGPAHARVLRRWGERFSPPPGHEGGRADAVLWTEAMAQLEGILRAKGIVA